MHLLRRFRPALVVNAALATTLLAVAAAGDSVPALAQSLGAGAAVGAADAAPPGRSPVSAPGATSREPSGASPNSVVPDPDALLADALATLPADRGARLSVSILALESGLSAGYGSGRFDTASIVKVDILAALLLRAQEAERELTARERALAEVMIQRSDNNATDALWLSIGGAAGLDAANARLGLSDTTAGHGGHWGLTQTTSADQITLLRAVYGADSALDAKSRAYVRELMDGVVPGQRWGISAAADGAFELKNGWLPRTQTGLWDVNSIGRVIAGGQAYLVAVVSDGHATQAAGIAAVETAAEAAVEAVSTDPAAVDTAPAVLPRQRDGV